MSIDVREDLDLRRLSAEAVRLFLERLGDNLLSVVLFGSQVDGRALGDSDVDVLVVSEDEVSYPSLGDVCRRVNMELTLKYVNKVNSIPFHKSDVLYMLEMKHPFVLGLFRNNLAAYDPSGFFEQVLTKVSKSVADGEVRIYGRSGLVFVK